MGIEGICARTYYQALRYYFPPEWKFNGRNRRPPLDPINALLSWGYGVLLARVFSATVQAGLDPYLGFFHATESYRPNLVLDLMEEFRPVVVDQAVISIIESNILGTEDFQGIPSIYRGKSYSGIHDKPKELRADFSRIIVAKEGIFPT
jgi:CRISPR-associated protein Cas1